MAKSQKIGDVKITAASARTTADEKISAALKQASLHAKKQLALQGLNPPTQSWAGLTVRDPVR